MESRVIVAAGVALGVLFVLLGVFKILPWEAAGTLAATAIGVISLIIIGRQETKTREATKHSEKEESEDNGKLLWEESILVAKDGCSHYELTVNQNEKVTGEISSDDYFNVYFLNPRNFTKYENGDEDFRYTYGTEHASKMKINFQPDKTGRFYCVIESASQKDLDVKVVLYVKRIQSSNS